MRVAVGLILSLCGGAAAQQRHELHKVAYYPSELGSQAAGSSDTKQLTIDVVPRDDSLRGTAHWMQTQYNISFFEGVPGPKLTVQLMAGQGVNEMVKYSVYLMHELVAYHDVNHNNGYEAGVDTLCDQNTIPGSTWQKLQGQAKDDETSFYPNEATKLYELLSTSDDEMHSVKFTLANQDMPQQDDPELFLPSNCIRVDVSTRLNKHNNCSLALKLVVESDHARSPQHAVPTSSQPADPAVKQGLTIGGTGTSFGGFIAFKKQASVTDGNTMDSSGSRVLPLKLNDWEQTHRSASSYMSVMPGDWTEVTWSFYIGVMDVIYKTTHQLIDAPNPAAAANPPAAPSSSASSETDSFPSENLPPLPDGVDNERAAPAQPSVTPVPRGLPASALVAGLLVLVVGGMVVGILRRRSRYQSLDGSVSVLPSVGQGTAGGSGRYAKASTSEEISAHGIQPYQTPAGAAAYNTFGYSAVSWLAPTPVPGEPAPQAEKEVQPDPRERHL